MFLLEIQIDGYSVKDNTCVSLIGRFIVKFENLKKKKAPNIFDPVSQKDQNFYQICCVCGLVYGWCTVGVNTEFYECFPET